jgi:hypothetical protein
MIQLTCNKCKEEVSVPLYFYDVRILTEDDRINMTQYYIASALGKAICPHCGNEIREQCRCPIFKDDVVELATRRYPHG